MELTREQAIKEHRKMWNWLAENPDMDKDDYLELNDFEYVENECFLCHYSHQNDGECCEEDCILDWGETSCMGNIPNLGLYQVYIELVNLLHSISLYSDWSVDIIKTLSFAKSRTARAIAELPENIVGEEE